MGLPAAVLAVPIRVRALGMRRRLRRERIEIPETEVIKRRRARLHLEEIEDVRRQAEAKGFEPVGVRLLRVDPEPLLGVSYRHAARQPLTRSSRQRLVSAEAGDDVDFHAHRRAAAAIPRP